MLEGFKNFRGTYYTVKDDEYNKLEETTDRITNQYIEDSDITEYNKQWCLMCNQIDAVIDSFNHSCMVNKKPQMHFQRTLQIECLELIVDDLKDMAEELIDDKKYMMTSESLENVETYLGNFSFELWKNTVDENYAELKLAINN
jgi:hypothetical protein